MARNGLEHCRDTEAEIKNASGDHFVYGYRGGEMVLLSRGKIRTTCCIMYCTVQSW